MDSGDCETEEDSAPEACVSPGPLLPSNSREMRNRAEKQRRDKLNALINQLAAMVPIISRSAKRMDKTSILRLTATYLRIYQTLVRGRGKPNYDIPKQIDQLVLEQLVCDQLGGFLLILTSSGKIVFVSPSVENLLGHLQTDLMGQSIFNITCQEDHMRLRTYLTSEGDMDLQWRKYFHISLKRAGPRTESPVYEPVTMMGMQKMSQEGQNSPSSSLELSPCSSSSSTSLVQDLLVFFVKVCRPEPLVDQLIEASKDEYMTRHLIDGRIINCDQRISIVAGYMIEEVSGHSAFKYMHKDDVHWVLIALGQMYDRGESKGNSCYRLISRNGQFIYLRTHGFLEIDDSGTVESFVCVNSLVTEREGIQLINEMKKRFSAFANTALAQNLKNMLPSPDVDGVEEPQLVDEAVAQLMRNLPSPTSDACSTPSPYAHYENQDCSSSSVSSSFTDPPPAKPIHVRLKTRGKRSASNDQESLAKIRKTSPHHSPYSGTQITELTEKGNFQPSY